MSFSYRIRHQIPGRLRLKISPVRQITDAGAQCSALEGVLKVRINAACASLIVHYDCSRTTHTTLLAALQQAAPEPAGEAMPVSVCNCAVRPHESGVRKQLFRFLGLSGKHAKII